MRNKVKKNIFLKLFIAVSLLGNTSFPMLGIFPQVQAQTANCSFPNDKRLQDLKNSCEKRLGHKFNCETKRCFKDPNARQVEIDLTQCEKKTGQEREDCFISTGKSSTRNFTGVKVKKEDFDKGFVQANLALAFLSGTVGFSSWQYGNQCTATSAILIFSAGVTNSLSELVIYLKTSSTNKKVIQQFKKDMQTKKGTDAQQKAFKFLSDEQRAIAKNAKLKSTVYFLISGIYAAALTFTILEQLQVFGLGTGATCGGSEKKGEKATGGTKDIKKPATKTSSPAKNIKKAKITKPLKDMFFTIYERSQENKVPYFLEDSQQFVEMAIHKIHHGKSSQDTLQIFKEHLDYLRGSDNKSHLMKDDPYHLQSLWEFEEVSDHNHLKDTLSFALSIINNVSHVFIPQAHAFMGGDLNGVLKMLAPGLGIVGLYAVIKYAIGGKAMRGMEKFMNSPITRGVLATIGTGTNLALGAQALGISSQAEKRSKALRKTAESFRLSKAGFIDCQNPANKPKPACFCFKDGKINPERARNKICQAYIGVGERRNFEPSLFETLDTNPKAKGCVNKLNQFDPQCSCQKQKLGDGSNNCLKVKPRGFSANLGGYNFIKQTPEAANALTSGSKGIADLNNKALRNAAFRNQRAAQSLINKAKTKKKIPFDLSDKTVARLTNQFLKTVPKKTLAQAAKGNVGSMQASAAAPSVSAHLGDSTKKALNSAIASSGMSPKDYYDSSQGGGSAGKSSGDPSMDDLFGSAPQGSGGGETVEGFMNKAGPEAEKEYDYKKNDIRTNAQTPLWKVITHRYNQSGVRKLFAE